MIDHSRCVDQISDQLKEDAGSRHDVAIMPQIFSGFGQNPGIYFCGGQVQRAGLAFDPNGHVSQIITRSDLPKFASHNRQAGTPEENKTVVQGSIAYFGTYSVSETDKTYTLHVESCTFPNWNGTERKYSFDISGDELNITPISATSTGKGTDHLVWRRAK